jgi:CubicO group peptidase (beta-lactamase class C family)
VSFKPKEGELTLNAYVVHPNHRVQAVVMIHKGKIVYESYPGMNPHDLHVWMSPGKTTVALVIAQLEAEGKIDMNKEVTLSIFLSSKGTNWDGIKMIDAANMATALTTGRNDGSHRGPNLHHRKVFQCGIWVS